MQRLKNVFNPIYFDSDHMCKMAKECGVKYIVITAKHHEGFALFDSKVSDFTIMHTPFKRDIIKELAESCMKYNQKLGLYYSQILDWNEFDGGGYNFDPSGSCGDSYANDLNFKSPKEIVKTRLHLEKLGVNYLVNVGPDWLGRIPYKAEEILRKVQELYLLEKSK